MSYMPKGRKIGIAVLLTAAVITATVSAADAIKAAVYSDSPIHLDGERLELKNKTAMIANQGEDFASTYIPLRELLEQMGYTVSWDEGTQGIYLTSPDPLQSLIAAESGGAKLYNVNNNALLEYAYFSKAFSWPVCTTRMRMPDMKVYDVDEDGQNEIVISANKWSGTGIDVWDLHVIEIQYADALVSDPSPAVTDLVDYAYINIKEQLLEGLSFTVDSGEGSSIVFKYGDVTREIDITDFNIDISSIALACSGEQGILSHVYYEITDDGIKTRIPITITNSRSPVLGDPVATLAADVKYKQGSFSLENVEFLAGFRTFDEQ